MTTVPQRFYQETNRTTKLNDKCTNLLTFIYWCNMAEAFCFDALKPTNQNIKILMIHEKIPGAKTNN